MTCIDFTGPNEAGEDRDPLHQMECGSRFEGSRRGGGQYVKCAERDTEELTEETQTPCSHLVRYFR
jgi:hypothetical protein